jgi:hypothetical protein
MERNGMDFGYSTVIDSNYVVVGSPGFYEINGNDTSFYMGAAFVFSQDVSGKWNELGELLAFDRKKGDYFGYSVSMDYPYIVVGAPRNKTDQNGINEIELAGSSYLYKIEGDSVRFLQKITSIDRNTIEVFGITSSIYDSLILISSSNGPSLFRIINDSASLIKSFETFSFVWEYIEYDVSIGNELFGFQIGPLVEIQPTIWQREGSVMIYSYNKDELSSILPRGHKFDVSLFPNPFYDRLNLSLPFNNEYFIKIFITNMQGEILVENVVSGLQTIEIDCSTLPRGIYLVTILTQDYRISKKIVKI